MLTNTQRKGTGKLRNDIIMNKWHINATHFLSQVGEMIILNFFFWKKKRERITSFFIGMKKARLLVHLCGTAMPQLAHSSSDASTPSFIPIRVAMSGAWQHFMGQIHRLKPNGVGLVNSLRLI